jgi:hypothetical protein
MLVFIVGTVFSEVKNNDSPAKGELNFKLDKIWEIEGAGEEPFARIRQVLAAEEGTVYVYDNKNMHYYIFDKNGKLVRAFGKKGEGPGEIRRIEQAYMTLAGDKLVIGDLGRIHYFDRRGNFIRSKVIARRNTPVLFLNEHEYITAHLTLLQAPDGKGTIRRIDLQSGTESVIKEFSMFQGGAINTQNVQAAAVIPSLTPMMIIGYHDNKLYFGMNDNFQVTVSDMKGNVKTVFSLTRAKRSISKKVIEDRLIKMAKGRAPVDVIKQIAKILPNVLTYFSRIEVHNGLIYCFTSYYVPGNIRRIDIFSPEGKYLYRAFVKVPEEFTMTTGPIIRDGHVFLTLENEEGDQTFNKYKIDLPEK